MMNPLICLLFVRNEYRPVFYLSIKNRSALLVDLKRLELSTSRMRTERSPS